MKADNISYVLAFQFFSISLGNKGQVSMLRWSTFPFQLITDTDESFSLGSWAHFCHWCILHSQPRPTDVLSVSEELWVWSELREFGRNWCESVASLSFSKQSPGRLLRKSVDVLGSQTMKISVLSGNSLFFLYQISSHPEQSFTEGYKKKKNIWRASPGAGRCWEVHRKLTIMFPPPHKVRSPSLKRWKRGDISGRGEREKEASTVLSWIRVREESSTVQTYVTKEE